MRKSIVNNANQLASVLAKSETGLSQSQIGDIRQLLKILITIEAAGFKLGRKSIFAMLRREAKAKALKIK